MSKRFVVSAAGSVAHLRLVPLEVYQGRRATFTHLGTLEDNETAQRVINSL